MLKILVVGVQLNKEKGQTGGRNCMKINVSRIPLNQCEITSPKQRLLKINLDFENTGGLGVKTTKEEGKQRANVE